MATVQELEQKLIGLELNADRIRTRTEALGAEAAELKNKALSNNFKLPEQQGAFLAARQKASDARREFETSEADLSSIELEIANTKAAINAAKDQGPKTNSAGETQQEAQQAKDDTAQSQTPPAADEKINTEGNTESVAPTTVASNAQSNQPTVLEAQEAPPKLDPGTNANAAAADPAAAQGASPTPTARDVLQQFDQQSDARYSYIYKATQVISKFSQGSFTQEIVGALIPFTLPPKTAQAQSVQADPNQSTAETRRLIEQNNSAASRDSERVPPADAEPSNSRQSPNTFAADAAARRTNPLNLNPDTGRLQQSAIQQAIGPLAPALTRLPTSNGQSIAVKTFAEDVAARKAQLLPNQLIKKD